jgi:hypothetical protein
VKYQQFEVLCKHFSNASTTLQRVYAHIQKHHVEKAQQQKEIHTPLSLNIFVLESISKLQQERQMPLLTQLLKLDSDWLIFDKPLKVNKLQCKNTSTLIQVADNTVPNVLALLSGKMMLEPKEAEIDNVTNELPNPTNFDTDINFLWKQYSAKNCATAFLDDTYFSAYGFGFYSTYSTGFTK